MSAIVTTSGIQICVFALGLAAIHATRSYAGILTRVLLVMVILVSAALLLVASLILAPVEIPDGDIGPVLGGM